MAASKIVTRFAPSPTGYLHIGGARTALFSWAFARRHGGTFILRMEDTDVARSTAESTRRIIGDLQWLGLEWDEGPDPDAADVYEVKSQKGPNPPYFQSQRGYLYEEYLQRLIKIGRAYRCFKTPEQLKADRDAQKAAGRPMKYDPTEALSRSEADQQKLIAEGKPFVWRFRMPDADVTVDDLVLGQVTIRAAELEDFIIVKSSGGGGGPTFHFANVVDDATMGVTHVLRAQEHLMNTPKHVAMFDALGIARPNYAHMPLIFNPDGTKMSKRDKAKTARQAAQVWIKQHGNDRGAFFEHVKAQGMQPLGFEMEELGAFLDKKSDDNRIAGPIAAALGVALPEIDVHDFRASGYLKDVVLNYVALLGWSPGGNLERFDLDYLKREFDLERLGKSNARFDRAKLLAFNAETLQRLPVEEFRTKLAQYLNEFRPEYAGLVGDEAKFAVFAQAYQPRARVLSDPAIAGRFFILADDRIEYDPKAVEKVLKKNDGAGLAVLTALLPRLEACEPWTGQAAEQVINAYAQETGKGLGDVAQPIRVAVSGATVSPPIHETLAILGKAATVARIRRCIEQVGR